MASPSLDGTAVLGVVGSATSKALPALTTAVANDEILVCVSISQNATVPNVASVSSAHLTFNFRSRHQHPSGSPNCAVEVWAARATGTLTSEVITVTLNAAPDCWCVAAQAFQTVSSGVWDPNGSLPASGDGGGATSVSGVSTSNPDDLLVGVWAFTSQPAPAVPSGWTSIASQTSFLGGGFSSQIVACLSVSSLQSAITVTTSAGAGNYAETIDALTADTSIKPINFGVIVGA